MEDKKKSNLKLPYGVVNSNGYDTENMTPTEVVEKFKELTAGDMKERLQQELPKEPVVVKVKLDDEFQNKLNKAETSKERQKIAFRYIMDNLCGEYTASDGRAVSISSVGADKITHRDIEVKLRVSPQLAELIRVGELQGVKDITHKKFSKFAYYKVSFQIGEEKYIGLLNVGIRNDGSSTLYDLNPFNKQ